MHLWKGVGVSIAGLVNAKISLLHRLKVVLGRLLQQHEVREIGGVSCRRLQLIQAKLASAFAASPRD